MSTTSLSSLRPGFIAFISPQNTPIYIRSFPEATSSSPAADSTSLLHHNLAFSSLDYVDQAIRTNPGGGRGKDGYLGLLVVMDDLAIYGYKPSSNITILVAFHPTSQAIKDSDVISIFHALHLAYIHTISNPFHPPASSNPHIPRDVKPFEASRWLQKRVSDIASCLSGTPARRGVGAA